MRLTDKAVRGAQPTGKDIFIADGGGLYIRIGISGTKIFMARLQQGGRRRWVTLGKYPEMSLAEARRAALTAELPSTRTFNDAFDEYRRRILPGYKSRATTIARITRDVLPALGGAALNKITRAQVADCLQKIVDRGAPVAANRALAEVQHIFDYAVERGWLDDNPATRITRRAVGGREASRSRTLSFAEIAAFTLQLRAPALHIRTRLALALVLLTGQRPSEVLSMRAEHIAGRWWTIPAECTKPGRAQKVYLSTQAAAVFRMATRLLGARPFACDHRALSHALRRQGCSFTPHDLRRTMATRLSDLGVMPHVIEKMLNHQMEGVMAVYNRAEFLPERKLAWQLWGAKIKHLSAEARRQCGSVPCWPCYSLRGVRTQ